MFDVAMTSGPSQLKRLARRAAFLAASSQIFVPGVLSGIQHRGYSNRSVVLCFRKTERNKVNLADSASNWYLCSSKTSSALAISLAS